MVKFLFLFFSIYSIETFGQISERQPDSVEENESKSSTKHRQMDTAFFWEIMDFAFAKARFDNTKRELAIIDQLTKLTPEQIQQFEILFQQMNQKASNWRTMAAHTIIEGGSSDDTYFYFRCWLISLGKKNFDETLSNPDYLASLDIPVNTDYGYGEVIFEEMISISDKAYSVVTGKHNEDENFPRAFAQKKGCFYDSDTEIEGEEWTDAELPQIAPRLYKKFRNK